VHKQIGWLRRLTKSSRFFNHFNYEGSYHQSRVATPATYPPITFRHPPKRIQRDSVNDADTGHAPGFVLHLKKIPTNTAVAS
jgi:hypothetical protein